MRIFQAKPEQRLHPVHPGGNGSYRISGRPRRLQYWRADSQIQYRCPTCGQQVLLDEKKLVDHCFNLEKDSVFGTELRARFDHIYDFGWDFLCPGCNVAVRLCYECNESPPWSGRYFIGFILILETRKPQEQ